MDKAAKSMTQPRPPKKPDLAKSDGKTEDASRVSDAGGSGGTVSKASVRSPSGMTSIREARMERRAIERGWHSGSRWDTRRRCRDLVAQADDGQLSPADLALRRAIKGLRNTDDRVASQYVRAIVSMESQNQKDDLFGDGSEALTDPVPMQQPLPQGDVTINVNQTNIAAGGISPADELRSLISSAVTTRTVPPGTNGNGSNGHH